MDNLQIYNAVRSVPPEAQKPIQGGRLKGKTDINPMWRIKSLTEEFGACGKGWYYEVINKWLEKSETTNEVAGFVEINLFVKYGEEWSKPIYGIGGSMFIAKEKAGLYVSDEVFKMATTDAISVACKQLGFGADVYWEADKTKYSTSTESIIPPSKEQLAKATELGIDLEKLAKYNKCTVTELSAPMFDYAIKAKETALKKAQGATE